jgi:hypothetical protein
LDQEESEDYYTIVEIEVSPGDDLSDLGFSVRESGALPAPRFCANGRCHPLGSNIFASSLPEIEILNWTPGFARDYWIWADDGSGERRVDVTPDSSRFRVSTVCPAQGTIWLEQKTNTPVTDRLAFSVVPPELAVSFVESCGAVDAPIHIQTRLPAGWLINWRTPANNCGRELWRVSPDESLVEGIKLSFTEHSGCSSRCECPEQVCVFRRTAGFCGWNTCANRSALWSRGFPTRAARSPSRLRGAVYPSGSWGYCRPAVRSN